MSTNTPNPSVDSQKRPDGVSRRSMLKAAVGAGALAATLGGSSLLGSKTNEAQALLLGPLTPFNRRARAYTLRAQAALFNRNQPLVPHPCNGDEQLYPNRIGSYTKGLPHMPNGEVNQAAYFTLLEALLHGQPSRFENIQLFSAPGCVQRKLVNPQAGIAFDLEGIDHHQHTMRAAPAFASAEEAGEIAENYWMALLRDVNFLDYDTNATAMAAAQDLTGMSDFRGPKVAGQVTTGTLFRENVPGALVGPYISQFLWLDCPFGANFIEQRMRTPVAGNDFMTNFNDWLFVQNGCVPPQTQTFDQTRRYIRNGRDLSQWVHIDVLFQAYFHACLILGTGPGPDSDGAGIGAPLNVGNPYNTSATQIGFGTLGGPYIKTLLCEVATRALKAVWFQKWFVHRRLRPEVFAERVHMTATNAINYPVHSDILNSSVLPALFSQNGGYFLPMVFPEGSPLHPAYGAGHATVAGACVTILKAMFDESYVIPQNLLRVPDATGTSLLQYNGPALTVGGELNKLAANVALGRNIAGVHWRTDGIESMKLGEAVAISILRDQKATFNENFPGFTFTKFDGTQITV